MLAKQSAFWLASKLGPQATALTPRFWVLMYHRILPLEDARYAIEEPGMVVTPATFREHLRIVKKLFEPMLLSEWLDRRRTGRKLPLKACAVTFDDGWLDNYEFALPVLRQEQVPATLFAVSHMIGTQQQFWPNRLAKIVNLAGTRLNSSRLKWLADLGAHHEAGKENVAEVVLAAKRLSDQELDCRLREAEEFLNLAPDDQPALMDWNQLREMRASGLVEIGSHTCNHIRLVEGLDNATMTKEIVLSKALLEEQLDCPVNLFCYPNGDASTASVELVRKHYHAAVTTQTGVNRRTTDSFLLERIGLHEDVSRDSVGFRARLSGWF